MADENTEEGSNNPEAEVYFLKRRRKEKQK
jgi:hypothetical protein